MSRHKIALGVAASLEYLHMSLCTSIIHRDIKPTNIHLHGDMEAAMLEAQTYITASIANHAS